MEEQDTISISESAHSFKRRSKVDFRVAERCSFFKLVTATATDVHSFMTALLPLLHTRTLPTTLASLISEHFQCISSPVPSPPPHQSSVTTGYQNSISFRAVSVHIQTCSQYKFHVSTDYQNFFRAASVQFQSSFRAVSVQFQTCSQYKFLGRTDHQNFFRAVSVQFQSSFSAYSDLFSV